MKRFLFSIASIGFALSANAQSKVYEFTFDNSYAASVGTGIFNANDSTSFTTDRHGNTNSALQIKNRQTEAYLSALPYGTNARTIALWVKLNQYHPNIDSLNFLYAYGWPSPEAADIGLLTPTSVWHSGYADEHTELTTNAPNIWYHYAFIYDGTSSHIYRNGVLLGSSTKNWNTDLNADFFSLGSGIAGSEAWFDGAIDDLHIYDYALSATEIATLHTPATTNINTTIKHLNTIYPNPVTDILNIEVNKNTNISIVNLLGATISTQQVNSGKNIIDVSCLISGIYFIHSTNGDSIKFIKK